MKAKLLLIAILFSGFAYSQSTLTLGTGTSGSATRGPFQRSSVSSSSVYSRAILHYSATELASLSPSATISEINFDLGSTNIITASGNATMTVYMKNSSATEVVPTGTSWADAINGATVVGTYTFNTSNNFPGAEGFMNFVLDANFNYTGGALEVAVDWDSSSLVPVDAMQPNQLFSGNGSLNWHWSATTQVSLNYQSGSSSAPSTLNSTSNRKSERVNTQIVYSGATTPATSGQVIGQFPEMDGGMENQTADNTMSSAGSGQAGTAQTQWTVSSTSNSAVRDMTNDAALARTGTFSAAFQIAPTKTNLRLQSPSTIAPEQLAVNTEYTVQFFYKSSVDPGNDLDPGIYLNNSSGGNATNKTDATTFVADTWTKTYGTVTTGALFDASHWGVARMSSSNETLIRVDDFVVYSGSYDAVAPSNPTTGTYANNSGVATIGWTAPAAGVDGGGYVVFKYTTLPNPDNDPNQNGIYEFGSTTTNGTGSLTGTVAYIGTDTSFTDTYAAGNYYKIYAVDKAFNYSDEIEVSDAVLGVSQNEFIDFKVYPNPVKNVLTVQVTTEDISSIVIYNVLGKEVINTAVQNNQLNVSNLSKGIYLLKINTESGKSITKKIIKE